MCFKAFSEFRAGKWLRARVDGLLSWCNAVEAAMACKRSVEQDSCE